MKVFVTGGAGYVGSHCVRALCNAGHDVTVLDDLSQGHREAVDDRATFVLRDLCDTGALEAVLLPGGFDAVMHFAAHLDVGESCREPLKYYRNNVAGSVGLLEVMREAGVRKMVFSSTCATYGQPEAMPIAESAPQRPINPYGRSKLAVEWTMRDCAEAWGLGGCALRYFNAAGASSDGSLGEDHDPEIHLIPLVLQVALGKRECISIFGRDYPTPDGTCIRDYVHVEDLADAHVWALESQSPGRFRAFNVGTGVGTSVLEIVAAAREVTGHAIPSIDGPRRAGDPARLFADPGLIKAELGWSPRFTEIRDTIKTAWQWHQSNPEGYG